MDTPALVSLIGSTASAVATVILAGLTAWYVRLTHALVEETRTNRFPNVFADIEFDSHSVKFVLGNAGSSPALDVKLKVTDSVSWRQIQGNPTGLSEISVVKHGIGYLAPGRVLKFQAGYVTYDADFFAKGNTIEIEIAFTTEAGKSVTRQFSIDLQSYSGVLFESFSDPEREVAAAIRDAERHRSSHDPIKSMISRFGTKSCPSCGERIPSSAKKCPKCHEFIQADPDDDKDS